jgi:glutamate dehydrogenase
MSDTTRAAVQDLRQSFPTIDAVCRRLEETLEPERARLAVHTAELLFSKAPGEFLTDRSVDALAQVMAGAFQFLETCLPDRVDVQVFNPEMENEGWFAPVTVIRTNLGERPFIVDTIREFLHSRKFVIEQYIYPVIHVERDEEGNILDVSPSVEGTSRESLIHCEISRITDPETLEFIQSELRRRLQDVVRATDDFGPMVDALNDVAHELSETIQDLPERAEELREIQSFLKWLREGGFVFLGYRAYDLLRDGESGGASIAVEPGSGLGILRNEAQSAFASPVPVSQLPEGVRSLAESGPVLIISKTNAESTVHRRARMDYIGVKKLDEQGRVLGEHRFLGLFTSKAYSEDAENIPILRQKLAQIIEEFGVREGSHDYKETITIFNSMAKEELFLASADEIGADVRTVLASYHSDHVRVSLREDPLRRGVAAMVILPKDRFSGSVRKAIEEAFVRELRGDVLNYHLAMGEGDQVRLHFHLASDPEELDRVSTEHLESLVTELIRTWEDLVKEGLEKVRPPDEARRLASRYAEAFSQEYQAATRPETAVKDILELEAMRLEDREVAITLWGPVSVPDQEDVGQVTELVVFLRGTRMILSEFMPILEDAGLRVLAVNPYQVSGPEVDSSYVNVFMVQDSQGQAIDVAEAGSRLSETILAVRAGDASSDSLNSLVLTAGLAWREVEVLRAYTNYGFQLGAVPSRFSFSTALKKHPAIGSLLVRYFNARFDPAGPSDRGDRERMLRGIEAEFRQAMRGVDLLAEDRALRRLWMLIFATMRTNYFRHGGLRPTARSGGVPYISFKLHAPSLQEIAAVKNRLLYEVWVRSPRMEGIHLRGANVARGGIRWSDRPDDFRTEVLGLVNTQMVKNAVIVPAGSKGGFVPLRPVDDREAWAREGEEQYKTLIRGLLDITDNLADGEFIPPEGVVCFDDPDPYLVVAADKGTAKFSDVANGVAREYGFWLDDAFASGGSHGYDHKVVGITARGGWECVKRHFREMGKDIQAEPFTVVGIGDMSGDVFGNGMLLSDQIRLLAAFDHRHIFVDPDPDPATSFAERKRMFELGRSSWEDYDESLISEGGFVVPRSSKEVSLTPQAREALGIAEDIETVDGESLIRHILMAPAELLWNGGIGTYVKASSETHANVGDASNDAVRIDSPELRAKVVGEGGNLGLTQRARIEYALAGGRLNTDALDNSGGVDMSDREVNLKVLLAATIHDGGMDMDARNTLLEELTEPEVELVLQDNDSQSLAVSLDEIRVSERLEEFSSLMSALEREGLLDRQAERLPGLETLAERVEDTGNGLVRPELCVLLAYAKLHLKAAVLESTLPDDPALETYLRGYFPEEALERAGDQALHQHRLRREIIATQFTNDLVDIMGATFVHRIMRDTGRGAAEVGRAWVIAARLARHRDLIGRIRAVRGTLPAPVLYRWVLGLARVLERATRWVLNNVPDEDPVSAAVDQNLPGLATLRTNFHELVEGQDRVRFESLVGEISKAGAQPEMARSLITLRFLDQLLEILELARESGAAEEDSARAYYLISKAFQTGWLRTTIAEAAGDDRWEQRAAQGLLRDVARAHRRLSARVLEGVGSGKGVDTTTEDLLSGWRRELGRYDQLISEVREEEFVSLSALWAVVQELSALSERPLPE